MCSTGAQVSVLPRLIHAGPHRGHPGLHGGAAEGAAAGHRQAGGHRGRARRISGPAPPPLHCPGKLPSNAAVPPAQHADAETRHTERLAQQSGYGRRLAAAAGRRTP